MSTSSTLVQGKESPAALDTKVAPTPTPGPIEAPGARTFGYVFVVLVALMLTAMFLCDIPSFIRHVQFGKRNLVRGMEERKKGATKGGAGHPVGTTIKVYPVVRTEKLKMKAHGHDELVELVPPPDPVEACIPSGPPPYYKRPDNKASLM